MEKTILFNGHSIFYRVEGSGRSVVLVHGFGETGSVWTRQAEYLRDRFRLIVPDLPGSGRSLMVGDMSIDGMAEVIKAIIDAEEAGSITMIGHSMGGYITLAFAEKYGRYLSAFGLFHSTSYADSDEKKATRRKGIDFIRAHGAGEFLRTTSPNLFSPITRERTPQLVTGFINSLSNFSAGALVSYYEAMINRPDRTIQLKNAAVPVLFVMGKHDNAVPINDSLGQSQLPAESHITILQESGHMGMMEEEEKSNRLLEAFLEKEVKVGTQK